ncbi:hypothetical protein HMP0721_2330 [Pseudoramibacter alactolyticus ATCC 23263]|jgi:hypothetical protein|uniref:Uncharacterized protein n=2 Tax=Pseudoramibacter TaxID=113286 RepID=E6MJZ5_9FIRM|nr:hypothetical protein [Pseudoramibacter alactolyticus]EFV00514.1 hypothetical protein HMP0721_2330 [Pseudoramibacter alactolyticus ATCC 23263]
MKYVLALVRRTEDATDVLIIDVKEESQKHLLSEAMQAEAFREFNRFRQYDQKSVVPLKDMTEAVYYGDTGVEYQEAPGDKAVFIGKNYAILALNDPEDTRYVWQISPWINETF